MIGSAPSLEASGVRIGKKKGNKTNRMQKPSDSPSEADIGQVFEENQSQVDNVLKELIAHLQSGVGNLPNEHFDGLRNKMFEELRGMEAI